MKTPSSFFPGDIHSLLKSCDELLSLADVRMLYFDELPENTGLDELLKQQDEAVMMASVLMDIHRRLTDPELLEAVTSTWMVNFCKTAFRGSETKKDKKRRKKLRKQQKGIAAAAEEEETVAREEMPRYVHTDKAEMRAVKEIEEQLDILLTTDKILSERLCDKLRELQDKIRLRLEENKKMVDAETKEKLRIAQEIREQLEAELLRAKKNAAW